MSRVKAAVVTLWCAVAWVPFPAGFVLVRVLDPRQGDRAAFGSLVVIPAIGATVLLLVTTPLAYLVVRSAFALSGPARSAS